MSESIKIVFKGGEAQIIEKKSRFIAYVRPVSSPEEATTFIDGIKKMNWDAKHNCSAIVIGPNNEFSRCSDDGEPASTAGKPMLEVLINEGVHNVAVVVTRYFGGVLLGTGGLVRAYQKAVKEGLNASTIIEKIKGCEFKIETDYVGIGKLQYIASTMNLFVVDTQYDEKVRIKLMVPNIIEEEFTKKVIEGTNGKSLINKERDCFYAIVDEKLHIFI